MGQARSTALVSTLTSDGQVAQEHCFPEPAWTQADMQCWKLPRPSASHIGCPLPRPLQAAPVLCGSHSTRSQPPPGLQPPPSLPVPQRGQSPHCLQRGRLQSGREGGKTISGRTPTPAPPWTQQHLQPHRPKGDLGPYFTDKETRLRGTSLRVHGQPRNKVLDSKAPLVRLCCCTLTSEDPVPIPPGWGSPATLRPVPLSWCRQWCWMKKAHEVTSGSQMTVDLQVRQPNGQSFRNRDALTGHHVMSRPARK
jgi:hypothetical protein